MVNKVIVYICMSMDGYIATLDDRVEWSYDVEGDGGDNGYEAFYRTIGAVVMGRRTYEQVLVLTDEFPYADKPCYVLSHSPQPATPHVTFTNEAMTTLIPHLIAQSAGDIYLVGGSELIAHGLAADLIDEFHIAIIPKLLGAGIPLFAQGVPPCTWTLVEANPVGQMVMVKWAKKSDSI